MKKFFVCFAVLIAVLFAIYLIVLAKTDPNIPLLNGISFGDSADMISTQFGAPTAIVPNKYDMGMTFYEYSLTILNSDADVEFAFSEGRLEQVYICWSFSTEEEANEIFQSVGQEISDTFRWRLDFTRYAPTTYPRFGGEKCKQDFVLSKLNRAKQVYFFVEQTGTTVFVRCLDYTGK